MLFKKNRKEKNVVNNNHEVETEKIESIFPNASKMLQETMKKWSFVSKEKILKRMECHQRLGEREAYFFESRIEEDVVKELEKLGYKVIVSEHNGAPYFKILW